MCNDNKPEKGALTKKSEPVDLSRLHNEFMSDDFPAKEIGGAKGLEPTRYGDWERNGRCTDF